MSNNGEPKKPQPEPKPSERPEQQPDETTIDELLKDTIQKGREPNTERRRVNLPRK